MLSTSATNIWILFHKSLVRFKWPWRQAMMEEKFCAPRLATMSHCWSPTVCNRLMILVLKQQHGTQPTDVADCGLQHLESPGGPGPRPWDSTGLLSHLRRTSSSSLAGTPCRVCASPSPALSVLLSALAGSALFMETSLHFSLRGLILLSFQSSHFCASTENSHKCPVNGTSCSLV